MKKILFAIFAFLCAGVVAHAGTMTLNWLNENGTVNQTTNCELGGDLILPAAPTKNGYTFQGWKIQNYIPIEYLESTGTQWIDTGIVASPSLYRTQTKFAKISVTGSILGNQNGDALFYINSDKLYVYSDNSIKQTFSLKDTNPHTISLEYNTINITIAGDYTGTFTTDWNPRQTINLFANNYLGSHIDKGSIKLYFARFWNNDTLVRDFIPVLDDKGTPCMFDKVTRQFFYNQGTGQFIAGPVVNQ